MSTEIVMNEKHFVHHLLHNNNWTAHDFYGKYHLSRMKAEAPVPGTQFILETKRKESKDNDVKRYEKELEERVIANEQRLLVREKAAEITTRVHVNAIIGNRIIDTEGIIKQNEEICDDNPIYPDSKVQINKFMKSIKLGRSHYVSFAATTGYQSINYKEPEFQNTALHIAVQKGHVECVLELVKYKANPNLKNNLGNFPIHDAWVHWRIPSLKPVIEQQNEATCLMLRYLLCYNADPNSSQQNGNTPLHVAIQMDHAEAVNILLGFQADVNLVNNEGKIPLDLALELNRTEIASVLNLWSMISKQYVRHDFDVQWRHFLVNLESVISSEKSIDKILFELNMTDNLRKQSGRMGDLFQLDDPFLREARFASTMRKKLIAANSAKEQLLARDMQDRKDVDRENAENGVEEEKDVNKDNVQLMQLEAKDATETNTYDIQIKKSSSTASATDTSDTENAVISKKYKRKEIPKYAPFSTKKTPSSSYGMQRVKRLHLSEKDRYYRRLLECQNKENALKDTEDAKNYRNMKTIGKKSMDITQGIDSGSYGEEVDDNEGEECGGNDDGTESVRKRSNDYKYEGNLESEEAGGIFINEKTQHLETQEEMFDISERGRPRPLTNSSERRLNVANKVKLDGLFELYTHRPCTSVSSPMSHSIRTHDAPLLNTPEEFSLHRYLSTPNKLRENIIHAVNSELAERKNIFRTTKLILNKSKFGSYSTSFNYLPLNEREKLYERISSENDVAANVAASNQMMLSSFLNKSDATDSKYKAKKIDTVNDKRRRYVSADLLPPAGVTKEIIIKPRNHVIKPISKEGKKEIAQETKLKVDGVKESADIKNKSDDDSDSDPTMTAAALSQLEAERMRVLNPPKVKYGAGRLLSTHQMKGTLQYPWDPKTFYY